MAESKSRLLYILKYLWQNTDEEHFASTADIVSGLAEKDIDIDRHTLPADIEALQRAGFDIECQRAAGICIICHHEHLNCRSLSCWWTRWNPPDSFRQSGAGSW